MLSVARLPTPCRPEQPHGCGDGPQPGAWQAEGSRAACDSGLPGLPGTAAAKGGCLSASSSGEASRRASLPVQVVRPGVCVFAYDWLCVCACVCVCVYVCDNGVYVCVCVAGPPSWGEAPE